MGTSEERSTLSDEDICALYERMRLAAPAQKSVLVSSLAVAQNPPRRFITRLSSNTKVTRRK